MNVVVSKIDQAGRLSISSQHRRAMGLDNGGPVVITMVGKELRISSVHSAMGELQAEAGQFLRGEAASVESFIAQRRLETEQDENVDVTPDVSGDAAGGVRQA